MALDDLFDDLDACLAWHSARANQLAVTLDRAIVINLRVIPARLGASKYSNVQDDGQ